MIIQSISQIKAKKKNYREEDLTVLEIEKCSETVIKDNRWIFKTFANKNHYIAVSCIVILHIIDFSSFKE